MTTTATPNLRETRREMAAAKKARRRRPRPSHPQPEGDQAPTNKAAPKAAKKAPARSRRRLHQRRGSCATDRRKPEAGGKEQHATVDGYTYAITGKDKTWKATVTVDGVENGVGGGELSARRTRRASLTTVGAERAGLAGRGRSPGPRRHI